MRERTRYMVLSEASAIGMLWRCLRGGSVCVVATRSLFRGAATEHLIALVRCLRWTGRISILPELHPERMHHRDVGDLMRLTDVFSECEAWLAKHFDFEHADVKFGRYAQAYRHVCSNIAFRRFENGYMAYGLRDVAPPGTIGGLDAFDREFLKFRFGDASMPKNASPWLRRFLNLGLTAAVMMATAWSILRVSRLRPGPQEQVFLGSEYLSAHDELLWEEVVEAPEQLVVVARNATQYAQFRSEFDGRRRVCRHDQGHFAPGDALVALGEACRDIVALCRSAIRLPSDFYRALIVLPCRRMQFRGLFNRYRFGHFWGRDEYNAEHMMRTQELRRVGGVSMAIMHGIPSVCTVLHQLRYIDFDVYYVLGSDQYDRHYRQTWPAHMRVKAIGSHGASRALMGQLQQPCGKNIACFLGPSFHEDRIVDAVADIARQMTDRTVYINIKKPRYLRGTFGQAVDRLVALGLPNVKLHDGSSYELLLDCRYVINESSTLTAEALQFGRVGFALDLDSRFKALYYRRFPGICVQSASEAVRRIRDIEAGAWRQPVHLYKGLIEMSGPNVWDVLREDFGLSPRDTAQGAQPVRAAVL